MNEKTLASHIDYTILKADTRVEHVKKLCNEAIKAKFYSVCVPPYFVKEAVRLLEDSQVKVATVIGFPMGYASTPAKAAEARRALEEGADELDMVINISAVKSGNWNYVQNDIKTMTVAAQMRGKLIKIILETGLLNKKEIKQLCKICVEEGVDFVKTSTGFNGEGATEDVIKLLRKNLPEGIKINASGGIRNAKIAIALLEAGADRVGSTLGQKLGT